MGLRCELTRTGNGVVIANGHPRFAPLAPWLLFAISDPQTITWYATPMPSHRSGRYYSLAFAVSALPL